MNFNRKQKKYIFACILYVNLLITYLSWCLQTLSIKYEINPQIVSGVNFIAIITVCISCFYVPRR